MECEDNYFARRAEEERSAAERTSDPNARRTHLELAEAYERRAASIRTGAQPLSRNVLHIRPGGR